MMNFKKPLFFILIALIAISVIGTVSAEDLNSQNNQTFQDIQTQLDNAENNTTITVDGYYSGNGTSLNLTNKNITFAGINNATLDARGLSEIIIINSANVVFENINFINSNGIDNGAIYIDSSESTLINNCTFLNNSAIKGGAISTYSAILTINNSSFVNNSAEKGGACYIFHSIVSISNSRFINNSASSDSNFTQGGAILNSNSFGLNITNSTFIGNMISSQYGAGPVIFNRGPLYLDNITVNNSILNVTNSINGPIYNTGGNLTIINSNIENLTKNGTDLTYLAVQINIFDELSFNNTNIPLAYDLRNVNGFNYVTSIKNQAKGGNCWAFGSTAALESYLLQYYNETWDFSENNMKNLLSNLYPQGYDTEVNKGGFNSMAVAYWARWSGPVNESDDPYNDTGSYSPENLTALKLVQDILFLPVYNDVDDLKLAILNYGAISFMLYATNFRIDINGSVPISRNPAIPNHIVAIVGWNDTYPGSAFGENVSDGAFIIKNSWGTNYTAKNGTIMPRGDEGYYYMSYYDLALSKNLCDINFIITNVEQSDNYKSNYNYDSLGLVGGLGFDNETGYFANQFISNDDETLAAFSLYTLGTNSEYEAKIYVNGDLKTTQSEIIENPGYHTIKLDNKINLAKDDLFRIEVKLTTPGCIYPIAVEAPIPEYSSKATAEANQSFISKDGLNWIDLSENNEIIWFWNDDLIGKYLTLNNTNVCLKAFTIQQTFQDIQTLIDNAENNTIITLDGYYFGNGTAINLTNKNITFAGINNATLDARGLSAIFKISESTFSFNNINFINGNSNSSGVIFLYQNHPSTINNCTFINNSAYEGGAIYSLFVNGLKINNSKFINNKAANGGALYIFSSIISINNSIFKNNTATSNSTSELSAGGAIFNCNNYGLTISNSLFTENKVIAVYGFAPSIYNCGIINLDNVTIANSTVDVTNHVNSSIFNFGGYLTINNSNIENIDYKGIDLIYVASLSNVYGNLSFNNTNLPLAYDLRDVNGSNYVTPIKDQLTSGNCWSFGSTAALESYLLQYYNETWDFSENNMKNLMSNLYPEGWDYDVNKGGWNTMAVAYWTRWSGPVNESDDRYNDTGSYSPENLTALKQVQDILFIPVFKDVNVLKLAVLNYGAVSVTVYSANMKKSYNSPIYDYPTQASHMVCIIGWNDTYPGSAFGENVPDGAFIIKNSWGNYSGDNGYWYMSYYDLALTRDLVDLNIIITNAGEEYKSNYQYDPLGATSSLGFNNDTGYFANQFISEEDEALAAFSLYTRGSDSTYKAKIYVNGELKGIKSGTIVNPGYHTIKLDNKINLAKGDVFRIEVELTTPNCLYPIAVEAPNMHASKMTAEANQSFISKDGVNWIDISQNTQVAFIQIKDYFDYNYVFLNYTTLNNTNVCLKAFTIQQTFQDIQTLIDNAENNTIITLDGTYYGNGTPINLTNKNITFAGINNATLNARGLSAIFIISNSYFSFNNINFINGNSNSSGTIFLCQNHPSLFNNCTFINNSAYEGGAIYSVFSNELKINNSKFINNKATSGGALYIFSSIIKINDSIFVNNTAEFKSALNLSAGGAIFNCNNYGLTISNSLFSENKVIAVYGFAPSIYNTGKLDLNNVTIINSTIDVENHVTSSIFNYGGYLTINNSDIENMDHKGIDLIYVASLSNVYGNLSFNNTNLPEAYDLRNVNGSCYVTPIKDQALGGNCWAFGSTAALESYLLQYYNETWDFSENNLKNLMSNLYPAGWVYNPNWGGWSAMALAYWSRWSGPVNESDDRYNDTGSYSPLNLTALKHVQDVIFIPTFQDVNELKLAIFNYGAISYGLAANGMSKSANISIYDYPTQLNHIVSIVGWNDTYPGSAFGENVPDGAFIIKNSWGTDRGDEGYDYMSYYDLALTKDLVEVNIIVTNVEDVDNYKSNYQYDLSGYTSSLGFNNDTGFFANQFISEEDEALAAFSLYTRGSDSTYKAKIYVNGELKGIKSGTIVNPGYHTIKLDNKINLAKGDVFRIEVELTTPGCLYPIAVEAPNMYASKMTAEANQSFISKDGVNWIDISQNTQVAFIQIKDSFTFNYVDLNYITLNNTNVCLKAFTVSLVNTTISADNLTVKAMNNKTLDIILSTEENSPVANQVITVEINDLKINLTTDEKGIAHLPVNNFPAGVYEVNFTFPGANGYGKSKNSTTLTIIPLNTVIDVSITELENGNYLISGIIKDENGNAVSEGNLDITVGNKTYSNVIINSDGTFNLIISLPAGSYDITFNLTFTSPTFYNNSTLTLKDAIVVKNKTIPEKEEVKTTLSTGNPLIVLLLALIVIPFIRRKNL